MTVLDAVQWPAMVVTLLAAWLVASKKRRRRYWGFGIFMLSNALWILWGWHTSSYALIVLQVGLFFMNVRGARDNPVDATASDESKEAERPSRATDTRAA